MHVFYCKNNNVAKARREKKENFTKDKKDTYICIMYIKLKLMSTFTNMGDIYNNAWTEIHLCIQEFVYEK